eukprot:CAMPEP_0182595792 /NCGR_PEP_ID=MMETSP1324-20130603/82961_1 /TAXON_ID=236786 /ORGANISM="Florenciella sp., Strain RCC1587" /LENGTH=68 /DNA_ID=CAMNT_0024813421 /DNA_START=162 /DNA_END=365 /DNA_ORIENTATION=-
MHRADKESASTLVPDGRGNVRASHPRRMWADGVVRARAPAHYPAKDTAPSAAASRGGPLAVGSVRSTN